jgi:toxin-antitoxin system PIN domain toxin
VILADVNVLIAAFRPDSPHHELCRRWLAEVVSEDAQFGMAPLALSAVIRITTNPRIFRNPSELDEVFAFCNELLELPNCRAIHPGQRHWSIFARLCRETAIRGSLIADAWFAALAIESGCEWITLDRDFARFPKLRWRQPAVHGV